MVESLFCAECRDRLFMTAAGREKPADSGLSQKVRSSEGAFAWTETEVFMDKTMIIKSADRFWGYAYVHPRAEKKVEERDSLLSAESSPCVYDALDQSGHAGADVSRIYFPLSRKGRSDRAPVSGEKNPEN